MKKKPIHCSLKERIFRNDRFLRQFLALLSLLVIGNVGITVAQAVPKFTVNFKDASLTEVLDYLGKNSDYTFTYNSENVKNETVKITESFKDATLEQVLTKCLEKTRFDFNVVENHVIIKNRTVSMNEFRVKGKVVDMKGQPLPGVTIMLDGTKVGFVSDNQGAFNAVIPVEKGVLSLSFIGFKTKKVNFESGKELVVKMEEDVAGLDEVTVVAYGERKKREMIGSVSSVKGDEIKEIPSSSLESLLQGRMAGVEITNMSGAPGGGGAIVAIRGYNSLIDQNSLSLGDYGEPLYVVDGIPMQGFTSPVTGTNTLSAIDPATIESIEVLKDAASAAIYGSRAGRGVILITTKKGREGEAKFSANVSYSWSQLPSTPEQTAGRAVRDYALTALRNQTRPYQDPVTGIYKFPHNLQEAYGLYSYGAVYDGFWHKSLVGIQEGQNPVFSVIQDSLNPFYNNATNWFKYAFRTGKVLNANIQASGGSARTQYLIGAGVYDEKGIGYGSDFTRVNLLTNLNVQPVRNFLVDSRISLTYMSRQRGDATGGMKSAQKIEKMPVDPTKTSSFLPGGGWIEEKLLETINEQSEKNESFDLKASLVLNYDILPGLRLSLNGSASFSLATLNLFLPRKLDKYGLNTSKSEIERRLSVLNENLLSYKRSFNESHNIDLLAGLSFQKNTGNFNFGQGRGGASDKIHYIYEGFPELPAANMTVGDGDKILQHARSDFEETSMVSWFARVAYNYKQRYLTEFTFRQDGSSVFGDKNKYANFPAVALGWAFSEEKFLDWAWWLSYGKFRVSYGKSGEIFPDAYRAHGLMIPGGEFLGRPLMNIDDNALKNGGMINRELKWVKHDQYDFGLDMDFFDYRLKFKIDYYYRWSTGVIANSKIPKTIYLYENRWVNANDISNEGLEIEVVGDIIRGENWSWRTRFNASRNWNRLKKTFDGKDVGLTNGIPHHMLGKPLYNLWAFVHGKVYEHESEIPTYYTPNGEKYTMYLADNKYPFGVGMKEVVDMNGDGIADYRDKRNMGQTLPKIYGGWAHEVRWKNWDLNVLLNYSFGRKIACMYRSDSMDPKEVIGGSNLYVDLDDVRFWEKPGDAAIKGIYPQLSYFDATMLQFSLIGGVLSSQVETVNYVKLKQLTIGYNVPREWCRKIKLDNVRVFFTGENLFTITGYSGEDPEVVSIFTGIDNYRAYPLARKLTLGLTVNF
ncbi:MULTISPECIES: SusC/RagA family TonB-linked outer membrane protein [Butyricimonas]|uniref:SusC/RagA family TonB-linked outer membrane protein n=1 Tax=Butyricimonas hominis TaxID=2763032 RepID=A0ABR7D027_9BACT|nr:MULTISPECIES: SusC/RagA family TonB-linked outer membrane protein [Butyricimonas]MBC5621272.1 SusC/RagA family TonB-linked outer membrane protein [Butyricimonas hominis]